MIVYNYELFLDSNMYVTNIRVVLVSWRG